MSENPKESQRVHVCCSKMREIHFVYVSVCWCAREFVCVHSFVCVCIIHLAGGHNSGFCNCLHHFMIAFVMALLTETSREDLFLSLYKKYFYSINTELHFIACVQNVGFSLAPSQT